MIDLWPDLRDERKDQMEITGFEPTTYGLPALYFTIELLSQVGRRNLTYYIYTCSCTPKYAARSEDLRIAAYLL